MIFICYWVLHFFRPISWLPLFPAILLCHSYRNDSILLGFFRSAISSFPQGLIMAIGLLTYGFMCPFCFFSLGHPWLVCFLWAFSSLLLTPHSLGLLLTSLDFPDPITSFSSLGFMGLPLTPYFLCMHYFWVYSGPFSLFSKSYTDHEYVISLFSGFFKPIYLLKSHLFISWTCDPSFLPLGLDSFVTFLLPLLLGFFAFHLDSQKMTLNTCQESKYFWIGFMAHKNIHFTGRTHDIQHFLYIA